MIELIFSCKLYGVPENIQEFILDIDDNITCYVDKYYLSQIFDNLIINAITYNKGGKIKITLKYPIGVIESSISDEGTNIPEEAFTLTSRTYTPARR